jgi:hypothetical protein
VISFSISMNCGRIGSGSLDLVDRIIKPRQERLHGSS